MSSVTSFSQFLSTWIKQGGPTLAVQIFFASVSGGYFISALLESIMDCAFVNKWMINWKGSDHRRKLIAKKHEKIPWMDQLRSSLSIMFGPVNSLGSVILSMLLIAMGRSGSYEDFDWTSAALHFLLVSLITDFLQYCSHRAMHEIPFLYKHFHEFHHLVDTPTAISAGHTDAVEALTGSAIPMITAFMLVPVHQCTVLAYVFFYLANAYTDHCGLEAWWINLLTLRFLPLRSSVAWHDAHHRFGTASHAKNYAVMWTIWDHLLGTAGTTHTTMIVKEW